jgi:hypothetical protein
MKKKKKQGFAAMDPERRREVASIGGKNAQAKGTGHSFTTEEARLANMKSQEIKRQKKRMMEKRGKSLRAALVKKGLIVKPNKHT